MGLEQSSPQGDMLKHYTPEQQTLQSLKAHDLWSMSLQMPGWILQRALPDFPRAAWICVPFPKQNPAAEGTIHRDLHVSGVSEHLPNGAHV